MSGAAARRRPSRHDPGVTTSAAAFADLAGQVLDGFLRAYPETATRLGDHRFDDRIDDRSSSGAETKRRMLSQQLRHLDGVAAGGPLSLGDEVDRQVLMRALERRLFDLEVLRAQAWDPLLANPGTAIYSLLARDFAPIEVRLRSVAGRLRAIPESLHDARAASAEMPRVHVETAIAQFRGTLTLLATELERALASLPAAAGNVEAARDVAAVAIKEHIRWLHAQLSGSNRSPRLGPEAYRRKLALVLDTETEPDELLARAEADLAVVEERIAETAAKLGGSGGHDQVRRVLTRLATEAPVDDTTVVRRCEEALATSTAFVHAADLVTVVDHSVEVVVMPEIHRGVAVAYCDPPGPLETSLLPTYFAVSPTPEDWPTERATSFYREYNGHMLHNLTVHEAMPGHALQLAHARRHRGSTAIRAAFWSGSFVEGWAVLTEELMADAGYEGAGSVLGLRMQQLKMQLRMIINTILDIRVHCHGMTEQEAMILMTRRGHQEEGEAAGKWRRALLTSCQLPTYYVGYRELRQVREDLRGRQPSWTARQVNDALLAHGSPSPRHLARLLA